MKRLIALLVFLVWCLPALATDYYVRGYATWTSAAAVGSDGANGLTYATAKATLASLSSTIAAGDTVFVEGINFSTPGTPFVINDKDNVTVRQYPGGTQAHIHGGVRAALTGWTQSTNRYALAIGASKVICGVTWNYGLSENATTHLREAWLKPAGLAGNAVTVDNAAWTDTTKTLTQTGKFTGALVGGAVRLTGGTGVTADTYYIATVPSADAVTLTADINGASGNIASGVTGVIDGVQGTAWTWCYDASGAGTLYINANGGSPNSGSDYVTYVDVTAGTTATTCNLNGVYAQDSDGVFISGIEFSGFIGRIYSTTYYCNSIQFYTCNSSTIYGCNMWDGGIHAVSIAGLSCVNNRVLYSNAYGLNGRINSGADGSSQYTFYSGGGNVYGCRGEYLTAAAAHLLDPTGTQLDVDVGAGLFQAHTDGADHDPGAGELYYYVTDVEWIGCAGISYLVNCNPTVGASNQSTPPTATPANPYSYPMRAVDCTFTANTGRFQFGEAVSLIRCRFNLTPITSDPNDTAVLFGAGTSGSTFANFTACDFTMHMDVDDQKIMNLAVDWTYYLYNCSFLIDRNTTNNNRQFIGWTATTNAQLYARNCIFADNSSTGTTYLCLGDGSVAAGLHDIKNCTYFNIDVYSQNTSFDDSTEWRATIDTASQNTEPWFTATFPYSSTTSASHALAPTGGVYKWPRWYAPFVARGINGNTNSGHIGAWQYGIEAASRGSTGLANGNGRICRTMRHRRKLRRIRI